MLQNVKENFQCKKYHEKTWISKGDEASPH